MLHIPKLGGSYQLGEFVYAIGGVDRVSKILRVHPTTVRRWLRGDKEAPQAVFQALYWLTPWGFSDAYAKCHYAHQYMCFKVRQFEAKEGTLDQSMISYGYPANGPIYDTRPLLRLVPAA